jgi:phenylalanyl-tRNA synthetase beta subunit
VATTITFDYHGGERTLTQDEVNALHEALAAELARRFAWAPAEER